MQASGPVRMKKKKQIVQLHTYVRTYSTGRLRDHNCILYRNTMCVDILLPKFFFWSFGVEFTLQSPPSHSCKWMRCTTAL